MQHCRFMQEPLCLCIRDVCYTYYAFDLSRLALYACVSVVFDRLSSIVEKSEEGNRTIIIAITLCLPHTDIIATTVYTSVFKIMYAWLQIIKQWINASLYTTVINARLPISMSMFIIFFELIYEHWTICLHTYWNIVFR